jgi:hypothetical protein
VQADAPAPLKNPAKQAKEQEQSKKIGERCRRIRATRLVRTGARRSRAAKPSTPSSTNWQFDQTLAACTRPLRTYITHVLVHTRPEPDCPLLKKPLLHEHVVEPAPGALLPAGHATQLPRPADCPYVFGAHSVVTAGQRRGNIKMIQVCARDVRVHDDDPGGAKNPVPQTARDTFSEYHGHARVCGAGTVHVLTQPVAPEDRLGTKPATQAAGPNRSILSNCHTRTDMKARLVVLEQPAEPADELKVPSVHTTCNPCTRP